MIEAYLDDDGGPVVAVVEAVPENVQVSPQALLVRVGSVFYHGDDGEEIERTGVWVDYQPFYQNSELFGTVLMPPDIWRQLNIAVEERLARRERGWRRFVHSFRRN